MRALADAERRSERHEREHLHPLMTSVQNLERAVNATRRVYPYLWEADMRTPFNFVKHRRQGYRGYAHHGLSLIGTWEGLT